jgi:vacuolar-type H+-ATPase subunit F/Vma7
MNAGTQKLSLNGEAGVIAALLDAPQADADTVRGTLDAHKAAVPMVLEIPATGAPYDASKDAIMKRVLAMLGDAA